MNKIPKEKNFFKFNKGLFTEASELTFPEEASFDEENFELLVDGSRKRRKGLRHETTKKYTYSQTPAVDTGTAVASYKWRNAGRDPDKVFLVLQVGSLLHFYADSDIVSMNKHRTIIDLDIYSTSAEEGGTLVSNNMCDFSSGRGQLFVTGPYLNPIFIDYDRDDDTFEATVIQVKVRETIDVDDGISTETNPSGETCPAAHRWNLANRGWWFEDDTASAEAFHDDLGYWPAKNQIPWYGFQSAALSDQTEVVGEDVLAQNRDWFDLGAVTKSWNSEKMESQIFGMADAPKGTLIINPFDTTKGINPNGGQSVEITGWTVASNTRATPLWEVTITTAVAHGLVEGDTCSVLGDVHRYNYSGKPTGSSSGTVKEGLGMTGEVGGSGGTWTPFPLEVIDVPTTTTLVVRDPKLWYTEWYSSGPVIERLGTLYNKWEVNPQGEVTDARPRACEFFMGRLFMGGTRSKRWADGVFFSKIVQEDNDYGICMQKADPTHPLLNALSPDDGGYIQIPGIGEVVAMRAFGDALIVFGTNGVWEITGSDFFAANDYRVSKISDVEAVSPAGITTMDNALVYTSNRGVYTVASGGREVRYRLVSTSLTEQVIQTYWNGLSKEQIAATKTIYDSVKRRVLFLHNTSGTSATRYDTMLILDLRTQGFYKYTFNESEDSYILGVIDTDYVSQMDEYKKLKFFVLEDSTRIGVADFATDTFVDWNGTEKIPFLLTGYDGLGDWARQRYAPIIHTFMKRTETGYTEESVINESSLTMEARWNWADHSVANKFSQPQQIYKHQRPYIPVDENDTFNNGQPVIVVRSKVRGRGRSLQLKFTGEAGKDAHLLGWSIHYQVNSEV